MIADMSSLRRIFRAVPRSRQTDASTYHFTFAAHVRGAFFPVNQAYSAFRGNVGLVYKHLLKDWVSRKSVSLADRVTHIPVERVFVLNVILPCVSHDFRDYVLIQLSKEGDASVVWFIYPNGVEPVEVTSGDEGTNLDLCSKSLTRRRASSTRLCSRGGLLGCNSCRGRAARVLRSSVLPMLCRGTDQSGEIHLNDCSDRLGERRTLVRANTSVGSMKSLSIGVLATNRTLPKSGYS